MTAHWDAPANQWRSDLPADRTLRKHGRDLRAQGLTWPQIGAQLGMDENRARMPIKYPWRAGQSKPKPRVLRERMPKAKPEVTGKSGRPWQERVAAAYGLTWQQLQAIRAAGLTVKQFREMAAERAA